MCLSSWVQSLLILIQVITGNLQTATDIIFIYISLCSVVCQQNISDTMTKAPGNNIYLITTVWYINNNAYVFYHIVSSHNSFDLHQFVDDILFGNNVWSEFYFILIKPLFILFDLHLHFMILPCISRATFLEEMH